MELKTIILNEDTETQKGKASDVFSHLRMLALNLHICFCFIWSTDRNQEITKEPRGGALNEWQIGCTDIKG